MTSANIHAEAAPGPVQREAGSLTTSGLGRHANGWVDDSAVLLFPDVAKHTAQPFDPDMLNIEEQLRDLRERMSRHEGGCDERQKTIFNTLSAIQASLAEQDKRLDTIVLATGHRWEMFWKLTTFALGGGLLYMITRYALK